MPWMKNKLRSTRFWVAASFSVAAAVAAGWFIWRPEDAADPARMQAFAGAVASVAGSLFGFVLAAMSILISSDRVLIRNMRVTGHFARLHRNMLWSAAWLGATFVLALGLIVLPPAWMPWLARCTAAVAVLAACSTLIAGRRFLMVVSTLSRSGR